MTANKCDRIATATSLPFDDRKPQCNHCTHYEGVLNVQGHAPCPLRKSAAVLWNESCPGFVMATNMEEYIVAFRASELNVRSVVDDQTFYRSEMTDLYTCALAHYPEKQYGDAVPWNNQIWTVVQAENSIDALNTAYKFWINQTEEYK